MQCVTALARGESAASMKPIEVQPTSPSFSIAVTTSAVLPALVAAGVVLGGVDRVDRQIGELDRVVLRLQSRGPGAADAQIDDAVIAPVADAVDYLLDLGAQRKRAVDAVDLLLLVEIQHVASSHSQLGRYLMLAYKLAQLLVQFTRERKLLAEAARTLRKR